MEEQASSAAEHVVLVAIEDAELGSMHKHTSHTSAGSKSLQYCNSSGCHLEIWPRLVWHNTSFFERNFQHG